ncbi:MAG: hypothetical protein M1813_009641 [Trichoglossum hirsutum]|nr:MAG: hypothetical protein M1813_009641 [Trichoglossum hirsutum]
MSPSEPKEKKQRHSLFHRLRPRGKQHAPSTQQPDFNALSSKTSSQDNGSRLLKCFSWFSSSSSRNTTSSSKIARTPVVPLPPGVVHSTTSTPPARPAKILEPTISQAPYAMPRRSTMASSIYTNETHPILPAPVTKANTFTPTHQAPNGSNPRNKGTYMEPWDERKYWPPRSKYERDTGYCDPQILRWD